MSTPWVEKYRPHTLSEVIGNSETIERFKLCVSTGSLPNIVISGPPGCGKTTTIWAMAHDMLGAQAKEAVMELNASDDRGIDVVRNRIKGFAQKKVTLPDGLPKIIILDEADNMTEGAQQALRRIMEQYSSTTRFALACNQSDKIIEPIQSRCAIIRYMPLKDPDMEKRIKFVCDSEKVLYDAEGIRAVVFTARGDMRQALNNLQCTATGYGFVSSENVLRVCDEPHPEAMANYLEFCEHGDVLKAIAILDDFLRMGFSTDDIISSLGRAAKRAVIPEVLQLEFIREIARTHSLVLRGLTDRVQLAGLTGRLSTLQKKLENSSD